MSDSNKRWSNTCAYRKARKAVSSMLNSPKRLLNLVERAGRKSERESNGPIGKTIDSVKLMIRLLAAYAKGEYREVAVDNIALIAAALLYFVMPLDALPDFIAVLGLTDDAALLAWTWGSVKQEVERFLLWETQNGWQQDSGRNSANSTEFGAGYEFKADNELKAGTKYAKANDSVDKPTW